MQKKRNIRLLAALLLIIATIIFLQLSKQSSSNLGVEKTIFQLHDQQEITDVYLKSSKVENHFEFQNGHWVLNDTLLLDQSMRDVFFSVLSKVEIRKPVVESSKDSLVRFLLSSGVHTTITFGDDIINEYWVGGDQESELSWIMDGQKQIPYQVHIPGYQSYLAGIYNVPAKDWRSRFIFNLNFALLKNIEIEYAESAEKLELNYANSFFSIPGIKADSTKIANFLDNLAFLQADQFIDNHELDNEYDSLLKNNLVYATIRLQKVSGKDKSIVFYKNMKNKRFILAKIDDGSLSLFNYERIKDLFKTRNDFDWNMGACPHFDMLSGAAKRSILVKTLDHESNK